jgi:GT2 family glycosyltransferase
MFNKLTLGRTVRKIGKNLLLKSAYLLGNMEFLFKTIRLLKLARSEQRNSGGLIDTVWYSRTNEDLVHSSLSGKQHFISHGQFEGRDPNPFFDSDWYQLNYERELSLDKTNPLRNYVENKYSRNPNPVFATDKIIKELPEIGARDDNPLMDFLSKYAITDNRVFSNFDYFHSQVGLYHPEIYFPIACCMPNIFCADVNNLFSENKRAALIIPVHNKWAYTQRCLDSILRTNMLSKVDIYVIDDCSTDQTSENLLKIPYIKKVITNKSNQGYLRSVNTCFKSISDQENKYEYIGLINNDVEFLANSFDFLINQFDDNPDFGCLSPKVIYPDGRIQEFGALLWEDGSASQLFHNLKFEEDTFLKTNHLMESSYVSAACIFIRASSLSILGSELFDDLFFPAYYEDVDLCLRLRDSGFKVGVFGGSYVIHHEGISHGTNTSIGIKNYQVINQAKLVNKWGNRLKKLALPLEIPLSLVEDNPLIMQENKKVILIIDDKLPNPMSGGGEARMLTIVDHLKLLGFRIIFIPLGKSELHEDKDFYSNFGIRVVRNSNIQSVIDEINFYAQNDYKTYCLISRPEMHLRLGKYLEDKLPSQTKFIFDCVDLFDSYPDANDQKFINFIQSISLYDYVWTVNELEKSRIQKLLPNLEHKIEICSMKLEINPMPRFEATQNLILVGSLGHPPNKEMVLGAIEKILPSLSNTKEQLNLKIVGVGWEDWIKREYAHLDLTNVIFKEYVPDISAEIRSSRIMIAPLTEGTGIKIKVLDSIRNGVPVIGSTIAWEGICGAEEIEKIAVDEYSTYPFEIEKLYWDKGVWEEVQLKQSGFCANLNSNFLKNSFFREHAS